MGYFFPFKLKDLGCAKQNCGDAARFPDGNHPVLACECKDCVTHLYTTWSGIKLLYLAWYSLLQFDYLANHLAKVWKTFHASFSGLVQMPFYKKTPKFIGWCTWNIPTLFPKCVCSTNIQPFSWASMKYGCFAPYIIWKGILMNHNSFSVLYKRHIKSFRKISFSLGRLRWSSHLLDFV